jgi:hypothetical protein
MPKLLSTDAVAQYKRDGYYFPIRLLNGDDVAENRSLLEAFEAKQGVPLRGALRSKSHLGRRADESAAPTATEISATPRVRPATSIRSR